MAYSDLLAPFNIFGGSPASTPPPTTVVQPAPTPSPQQAQSRTPLPGEKVFDFNTGKMSTPVPPPPKTPTKAPVISPTYSFLDGAKYNASGKQLSSPPVVTAKPATEDLANKQAALTQATTAQAQQTQNIATQQANTQPQVIPQPTPTPNTNTTTTDQNGTSSTTTSTLPSATDQTNAALKAVQDQAESAFQSFTNALTQITNGTFPLTPAQQAQIQATQNSFAQLKSQQELVNKNYEGQVRLAGITSGRNITAPQIDLAQIHNAVNNGIQQIASIDAQASKAVADLQQGFMDKDYAMINDAYSKASDLFAQKSQTIQAMNTNVRNATNDALQLHQQQVNEAQQTLQNQQVATKFAIDRGVTKPFYLVGNTAIDSKTGLPVSLQDFQRATGQQVGLPSELTDFSQIQHVADPNVTSLMQKYPDAGITQTDTIQQAQDKLKGSALYYKEKYIAPTGGGGGGTISTTDSTGKPIDIPLNVAPYYNQSHNGVGWLDASTLVGTAKEKSQIIRDAQSIGLKVITNKNSAADLTNINDAYAKLKTIGDIMVGIDQPDALSRALYGIGLTKFAEVAQTNPQQAAAGSLNSIGLDILKAISGVQGFRGNQTAIEQVRQHLPSIYDTDDTVKAKIDFISQLIADRENAITGEPKTQAQNVSANTTLLFGPDNVQYNVPNDQVDAFIKAGGHK